jgi:hypothetical protein
MPWTLKISVGTTYKNLWVLDSTLESQIWRSRRAHPDGLLLHVRTDDSSLLYSDQIRTSKSITELNSIAPGRYSF